MPITPKFTPNDVARRFDKILEVIDKRLMERLQYLGELCVKHARELPSSVGFKDQTGNLRSSIGYMIFKEGKALYSNYEEAGSGGGVLVGHEGGGSVGVKAGQTLAKSIATENPRGIVLVVTAGMNYAISLESKGRDVLSSAELLAERELPKMIKDLQQNIDRTF